MNLPKIDFAARRQRAFAHIEGGAALIVSQPTAMRNSDVWFSYRQESLMYYLTGFEEPECALLLINTPKDGRHSVVFVRERDAHMELWEGRRLGVSVASTALGVDAAFPISSLFEKLPELIANCEHISFRLGQAEDLDRGFIQALMQQRKKRGRSLNGLVPVRDSEVLAARLRAVKAPEEVARMRKAAEITAKGFDRVFRDLRPGMNERQVQGMLVGAYLENGAEMEAYPAIVAGGANAWCLHYHENNAALNDGELLLIDSASQYEYYASDVTRTFPIGRQYTLEQRAVYEVVLKAQEAALVACRPGNSIKAIHDLTCRVISEGLVELGFLKGSVDEIFEKNLFKKYFPHGTGHWIGMDVHDVGDYNHADGHPLPLTEGMCFTVEPGIYVHKDDDTVPKAFRGLGIRIEDDVCITKTGHDNLTSMIPKAAKDLENRF